MSFLSGRCVCLNCSILVHLTAFQVLATLVSGRHYRIYLCSAILENKIQILFLVIVIYF